MSWVYFIRRAGDGCIKIGVTIDPPQRFTELRAQHGDLTVLAILPGTRIKEAAYHAQFAETRIERTEWFHPSVAIESEIASILATYGPPTAIARVVVFCRITREQRVELKLLAIRRGTNVMDLLRGLITRALEEERTMTTETKAPRVVAQEKIEEACAMLAACKATDTSKGAADVIEEIEQAAARLAMAIEALEKS